MSSLKTTLLSKYSNLDLSKGVLKSLCSLNDFYKSNYDAFPYKSIKTLLNSLEWPKSYGSINDYQDYPSDRENIWSDKLNGVTHDDQNWFFTQQEKLWKFPIKHDLNEKISGAAPSKGILCVGIPLTGYDHLGDLDYCLIFDKATKQNRACLFVALEDSNQKKPAKVALFDAQDLKFIASNNLTAQGVKAPWCAINPLNGLLYSSHFNINKDNGYVRVYEPGLKGNAFALIYRGEFKLFDESGAPLTLERVQGGVFSKNGHLYLVSDTPDGGILGFDMITGRKVKHIKVLYDPGDDPDDYGDWQELEGITIWARDSNESPGINKSQIHLIMIDNMWTEPDDLYFKHFWVSAGDEDKI